MHINLYGHICLYILEATRALRARSLPSPCLSPMTCTPISCHHARRTLTLHSTSDGWKLQRWGLEVEWAAGQVQASRRPDAFLMPPWLQHPPKNLRRPSQSGNIIAPPPKPPRTPKPPQDTPRDFPTIFKMPLIPHKKIELFTEIYVKFISTIYYTRTLMKMVAT